MPIGFALIVWSLCPCWHWSLWDCAHWFGTSSLQLLSVLTFEALEIMPVVWHLYFRAKVRVDIEAYEIVPISLALLVWILCPYSHWSLWDCAHCVDIKAYEIMPLSGIDSLWVLPGLIRFRYQFYEYGNYYNSLYSLVYIVQTQLALELNIRPYFSLYQSRYDTLCIL